MPSGRWPAAACLIVAIAGFSPATPQAPIGALAGQVVEDHSGAPVPGVVLRVARVGEPVAIADVTTDDAGRFSLAGLSAGDYQIDAAGPGFLPMTARLRTNLGSPVILRLLRFGLVSGQVVAPLRGGLMLIEDVPDGVTPRRLRATADASGAFRFWPVPPGRFMLAVLHPSMGGRNSIGILTMPAGAPPRPFVVASGETYDDAFVQAPMLATASLRGRVVAVDGDIAGRLTVRIARADLPSTSIVTRLIPRTQEFRLEDIIAGTYVVSAAENLTGVGPERERRGQVIVTIDGADVDVEIPTRVGAEPAGPPVEASREPASVTAVIDRVVSGATAVVVIDLTPGRDSRVRVQFGQPGSDLTFDGLAPGRYAVAARPAAVPNARWSRRPDEPSETIDLRPGEARRVVMRW